MLKKLARRDELDRIFPLEGNIVEGKRGYRLDPVKDKLKEASEITIMIKMIVIDLGKCCRDIFVAKSIMRKFKSGLNLFYRVGYAGSSVNTWLLSKPS